jgi:hypothetical protein
MEKMAHGTWKYYIKRTKSVLHEGSNIFGGLKASSDIIWPVEMGQMINFNKQVDKRFKKG